MSSGKAGRVSSAILRGERGERLKLDYYSSLLDTETSQKLHIWLAMSEREGHTAPTAVAYMYIECVLSVAAKIRVCKGSTYLDEGGAE